MKNFLIGLIITIVIVFVYFLIAHLNKVSIDLFKLIVFPLLAYLAGAVSSKFNSKLLTHEKSIISKYVCISFFCLCTLLLIFKSCNIMNALPLIIVISIICNWNTGNENKNNGAAK